MSKTKKENTTIKIKCDTKIAAEALFGYIQSFASEISTQVRHAIGRSGQGQSDPAFENINTSSFSAEFKIKPTDKGDVLVLDEKGELATCSYKDLEDKEIYAYMEGGKTALFERVIEAGKFDTALGGVANLFQLTQALVTAPEALQRQRIAEEKKKIEEKEKIEKTFEQDKITEEND